MIRKTMRWFGPVIAGLLRFTESVLAAETVLALRAGKIVPACLYVAGAAIVAIGVWETYRHIKPHGVEES